MTPIDFLDPEFAVEVDALNARGEAFAIATIVRTAGATAAKPGARALLAADGSIVHGWLGGGCTRGAVKRAAQAAIATGAPQLISVAPEEVLTQKGLSAGDEVDGIRFARNGCPSKGTIDVFVEPYVPRPQLTVFGASPVAAALCALAPRFGWDTAARSPDEGMASGNSRLRAVVVATQGQGDVPALTAALAAGAQFVGFVGSGRKFASLSEKLAAAGADRAALNEVRAPAGLDIGAVTPEEIALSILAELTQVRRAVRGQTLLEEPQ